MKREEAGFFSYLYWSSKTFTGKTCPSTTLSSSTKQHCAPGQCLHLKWWKHQRWRFLHSELPCTQLGKGSILLLASKLCFCNLPPSWACSAEAWEATKQNNFPRASEDLWCFSFKYAFNFWSRKARPLNICYGIHREDLHFRNPNIKAKQWKIRNKNHLCLCSVVQPEHICNLASELRCPGAQLSFPSCRVKKKVWTYFMDHF